MVKIAIRLVVTLMVLIGPVPVQAVNCLGYLSADRDFLQAVHVYSQKIGEERAASLAANLQSAFNLILMGSMAVGSQSGLSPKEVDRAVVVLNKCTSRPASCHFSYGLGLAEIIMERAEDTEPAAQELGLAFDEAQTRYISAYAEPEPGWYREGRSRTR